MCRKQMFTLVIFITSSISPHLPQSSRFLVCQENTLLCHNYVYASRLISVTLDHRHSSPSTSKELTMGYCSLTRTRQMKQQPEKREIKKVTWLGEKGISKTEETLSSLTGAPLHINERLGRNYILLPVRIHMPNYNIFIKWECNFHKGDYKRSTRSGKALSVLRIPLGRWCWCCQNVSHCSLALLKDFLV